MPAKQAPCGCLMLNERHTASRVVFLAFWQTALRPAKPVSPAISGSPVGCQHLPLPCQQDVCMVGASVDLHWHHRCETLFP